MTGVHLALSQAPEAVRAGSRGCCTIEDSRDARRAADILKIPFYVWDLADQFREDVIDDFVAEYSAGRTPNPCLRCNEKIKFAAVLDRARALGFDAVVTGHHAKLEIDSDGVPHLARSVDDAKDQSYVLAVLTPEQLRYAMFPLGDTTKAEVRREAAERGLAVADKPDSHDICFISNGDTMGFLREQLGSKPGEIVDSDSGAVVGAHDGSYAYTIGQRKGLRLANPVNDGKPRYVLSIEPVSNRITVGTAEQLEVTTVVAERPVWTGGEPPAFPWRGTVQMRAHGGLAEATAEVDADGRLVVGLLSSARGIAAGQAIVLYDGPEVVGSATIASASA